MGKRRRAERLNSHSSVALLIADEDSSTVAFPCTSSQCSSLNCPDMQVTKAMDTFQTKHRITKDTYGSFTILMIPGLISVCLISGVNLSYCILVTISAIIISCTDWNSDTIEIMMSLSRLALVYIMCTNTV